MRYFMHGNIFRKKHKAHVSKHKAYILKQVPCISKYMPCIFRVFKYFSGRSELLSVVITYSFILSALFFLNFSTENAYLLAREHRGYASVSNHSYIKRMFQGTKP